MNRPATQFPAFHRSLMLLVVLYMACGNLFAQGLVVTTKPVKCKGEKTGEAFVTGGKAPKPYTYQWSHNGALTSSSANDLKAGSHSVTVTDHIGCEAIMNFTIEEPTTKLKTILKFTDRNFDFCDNIFEVRVTLFGEGGTPPYTYPLGRTHYISAPGTYCYYVSDHNGCTSIKCITMAEAFTACRGSFDPNDIIGPTGYDELQWMSIHDKLEYMIRFENQAEIATGPAQYVEIRHAIDSKVNPFSVRLGPFGFGPYFFDVPENSSFYQTRLDLVDELGIYLDVVGGLDIVTNEVFWRLETIDPNTGQRPTDLNIGFLPPNDTLVNDGQGYVTYSVIPAANAMTRDTISADAQIVFDNNEPIPTNVWKNTMDALPPVSVLAPIPDTTESTLIPLSWTADDDAGGSGIASFNLYASVEGGSFSLAQEKILDNNFVFEGQPGLHYAFYIISIDNTGNKEIKTVGEDSTLVNPSRDIIIVSPQSAAQCVLDTLMVEWTTVLIDTVDLYVSLDSGLNYVLLADSLSILSSPYPWVVPDTAATQNAIVKIISTGDTIERLGPLFSIHTLPDVEAGDNMDLCINEFSNLIASGANTYAWSPVYNLDEPFRYKTLIYPDTSTWYYVTGTSVFGCRNTDSVYITVQPVYLDTVVHLLCIQDSVFVGGAYQNQPGYYTDDLVSIYGCDSVVVTAVVLTGPCVFPSPYVYVDKDATGLNNGTSWENAFHQLSDALKVAHEYLNADEIWVAEGDYYPHASLRDSSFVLFDSIKIYGGFIGVEASREERTADASLVRLSGDINIVDTLWDNSYHSLTMAAECISCIVDGVTITYGYADQPANSNNLGAGVINFGTGYFNNVIFERNFASDIGAAIYSSGAAANLIIENCTFLLNTSSLGRDVVNLDGAQMEFKGLNSVH